MNAQKFNRMTYEEQQEALRQMLDECSSDGSDLEDHDLTEDDEWVPPQVGDSELSDIEDVQQGSDIGVEWDDDDDSESDFEIDTTTTSVPGQPQETAQASTSSNKFLRAKDGTTWDTIPPSCSRTPTHNILRQRSGPVRATEMLSIKDTFKRFFDDNMCQIIIRETNRKARAVYAKTATTSNRGPWKELTASEFEAYLAILITSGVHKSNSENITELWKPHSLPLYRASMGINRFKSISRFLRFDNPNTREVRLLTDKAAPISELFLMLNANLAANYVPSDCITVDEQLFPFRGRTRFTQYIPSKPAKYGIKVWWACDSYSSYPLQGQIYKGKEGTTREEKQGERVVRDLCAKYKNSGRNITCDNFFTSLPLAIFLRAANLSIVGTLKKNKPYIPSEMKANKSRQVFSTLFGFFDNIMMCSYVPKRNKAVIMLSTLHRTCQLSDNEMKKPDVIEYYNRTKGGVDTMDKLLGTYSCQRKTLRWPVAFFYNMVNIAALGAYICFKENNEAWNRTMSARRSFLKDLGMQLALPEITTRSEIPNIVRNFSTRNGIESVLGRQINIPRVPVQQERDASGRIPVVGNCVVCLTSANKRKRKTRKSCAVCNRPICDEHCITVSKCMTCN